MNLFGFNMSLKGPSSLRKRATALEEQRMTQLYLIRHGEAMSAIHGFIGDGGLSPLGVVQA